MPTAFRMFPLEVLLIGQHRHHPLPSKVLIECLLSYRAIRSYGITLYPEDAIRYMREGRVNTIIYDLSHSIKDINTSEKFLLSVRNEFPTIVIILMGGESKLKELFEINPRFSHYYRILLTDKIIDDRNWRDINFELTELTYALSRAAESHADTFEYDIALSFAGEDRRFARSLAKALRQYGTNVFFDEELQPYLIGRDLFEYLFDIYSKKSRFCVILISEAYAKKMWTIHERKAIYDRMLTQRGNYVFPIRVDDTTLPGMTNSIAFLRKDAGVPKIAGIINQRLWITEEDDLQPKRRISG